MYYLNAFDNKDIENPNTKSITKFNAWNNLHFVLWVDGENKKKCDLLIAHIHHMNDVVWPSWCSLLTPTNQWSRLGYPVEWRPIRRQCKNGSFVLPEGVRISVRVIIQDERTQERLSANIAIIARTIVTHWDCVSAQNTVIQHLHH